MGKPRRSHTTTQREIVHQGGLLKHKRKKLQGFAKRWFVLDSNGILSYSVSPKAHIRDSINVGQATIARSKQSRSIHIDSDRLTWHLKAQTDSDFQTWTTALRKFIPVIEKGGSGVVGNVPEQPQVNMAQVSDVLTRMTAPIKTLQLVADKLEDHDSQKGGRAINKMAKILKPSHGHNNQENAETEAEELRKAHAQIFRYHQQLLEMISPSKAAGALAPEQGVANVEAPLIASRSALGFSTGKGNDSDGDDDFEDAQEYDLDDSQSGYHSSAAASSAQEDEDDEDDDSEGDESSSQTSVESGDKSKQGQDKDDVKRRQKLPTRAQSDPSGAFSVLKNNIGKDLTKISFPVSFNEPLSALQRQAEEMEHADLLKKAAVSKDISEKLAYIAAFAISALACTKTRASRKPFNPLLGETYELIRPDKGFKFASEKVSHHPPVNAFWAQDDDKKWTFWGATTASQKYWGRSLEVFPGGTTTLKIGEDEFDWEQRPNATVRGMMGGGEKTIEYNGKLIIKHTKSKAKVTVSFKSGGGWGSSGEKNKFEGKITDDGGNEAGEISGKWDESISMKTGQDSYKKLFEYKGITKESDSGFGWSPFACQLNEITEVEKNKLPPTDSRLRPDQRSYEDGDADKADKTKEDLENAQRQRRKKWEDGHGKEEQPPRYFKKGKGENRYEFLGDYWEKREKGDWPDFKIFEDQ